MNKKNKNIPKYEFGSYVESPYTALAENDINKAKAALKANNGLTKGLDIFGNLAMQVGSSLMSQGAGAASTGDQGGFAKFLANNQGLFNSLLGTTTSLATSNTGYATGGIANGTKINAEGGEIVETPNGITGELKGPSHAKGGIDMIVPEGTEIFSKKLKGPDGKTMAQRKKSRERAVAKLERALKDNPSDALVKKTLDRTHVNNELQEQEDLMYMQIAKMAQDIGSYATGGTVGPNPVFPQWLMNMLNTPNLQANSAMLDMYTPDPADPNSAKLNLGVSDTGTTPMMGPSATQPTNPNAWDSVAQSISGIRPPAEQTQAKGGNGFNLGNIFGNMTLGDAMGLAGTLYSMNAPMRNTLENRAGDTPNINAFANYGKEGLEVLDESKQYINQIRDQQLKALATSRNSAIRRGRNSARGVNTLRALDLAAEMGANQQQSQIFQQFAQAMQGILSQEAQMENQQDAMVMQGEQQRDLADRQDRDNFYTQMAQNIANKGIGMQKIASDVNTMKERGTTENLYNQLYRNFGIDSMTGQLRVRADKEIKDNGNVYAQFPPTMQKQALDNVLSNTWIIRGSNMYERVSGRLIDPTTGLPVGDNQGVETLGITPAGIDVGDLSPSSIRQINNI